MTKFYQPVARKRGDTEWSPVQHSGLNVLASDIHGAQQIANMLHQMAQMFPGNEFKIIEVEIPNG